jgi:formylglycine-generating enzyme required for sulfatase activity
MRDINRLSDREAMGMETHFYASELDYLNDKTKQLSHCAISDLIGVVEGKEFPLVMRYAAGMLLALQGDPRISTLAPAMITLPGAEVVLGRDVEQVDQIWREYAGVGVKREWIAKETPAYCCTIQRFNLAKYCVTHQEYRDFLADSGYEGIPPGWHFGKFPSHLANHPVNSLTVKDCEVYCQWLSAKTNRSFRLPTEAEWEYGASGGQRQEFPWGECYRHDHANTLELGLLTTTPVGMFAKGNSIFGLADMAGNVEEFTATPYLPYPGGEVIDDDLYLLDEQHPYRVARGGSFTRHHDLARCTRRHGAYPKAIYVMGFRLAEDIKVP